MFDENGTETMAPDHRRSGAVVGLRRTATGETFELVAGKRRWVVGSRPSCEVCIPDPYVSGLHCVLERKQDGVLVVRDQSSRNGTFVDGNSIEAAELRIGSFLTVGRTTLVAIGAGTGEPTRAIEMLRGNHPGFRMTIDQALRVAQTDCNILILGETGTGKDLLARAIHQASRRAAEPYVAINCGAISPQLIGSELFGHEKGSFTGASDQREGIFIEAGAGTLFLDEIGELPIELQPNLLRVLESRRVRRIGGAVERPVQARIISATNRVEGLGTETSRLRLDLYHRLATVVLTLPPLRDRLSDLPDLVESMLAEMAREHGPHTVSEAGWQSLAGYSWPGNVRELRQAVARAVALGGEELGPHDFFPDIVNGRRRSIDATPAPEAHLVPYQAMLRGAMEVALQQHKSIRAAAHSIGMPKSTFADRAKAWGLSTHRRPRLPLPPPDRDDE